MAGYRNLNESLAEKMIRAIEAKKQTETSPTGVKDLGESGDVVWSGEDGTPVSVRDMRADIDDLLAEGVALSKKNTVSTSNPPSSADGYPEDAWWTKITSQDDTTVVGLWQVEDGAWVARNIPDGGLVAPFADIGLMSVAMLSAKIITSGYFRTAASGQRVEIDSDGLRTYDATGGQTARIDGLSNSFSGEVRVGEMASGQGRYGARLGYAGESVGGVPYYGMVFTPPGGGVSGGIIQTYGGHDIVLRAGYAAGGTQWSTGVNKTGIVLGGSGVGNPDMSLNADGFTIVGNDDPAQTPAKFRASVAGVAEVSAEGGSLSVEQSRVRLAGWGGDVVLDTDGVSLDGYRWTRKIVTSTGDGGIGNWQPGRYDIRMNHPDLPTSSWGVLDVDRANGNWYYIYRNDLGTEMWTRTYANGAWTAWKNLMAETKAVGSIAWNQATGGAGTVEKHGNLIWVNVATVTIQNETIGTVAPGFRPGYNIGFVGLNENTNAPQKCWILTNGTLHVQSPTPGQKVSMTITYPAA